MKKILVSAMFAILCVTAASAQCENKCQENRKCGKPVKCEMKTPEKIIENRVDRMKDNLKLSDEQCKELSTIFTDFEKENEAMREKHRSEMQKRRATLDSKVEKVLTPEQLKIYKEKAEMRKCKNGKMERKAKPCNDGNMCPGRHHGPANGEPGCPKQCPKECAK